MVRKYKYNHTPEELPADAKQLMKGVDKFMKDKKKRYIQVNAEGTGTMGYWDKNSTVPMYALSLTPDEQGVTCTLNRQEKDKKPHDTLFALLCGVIAFAVLFVILGLLVKIPMVIAVLVSGIVGIAVLLVIFFTYFFEYRGFYALLDLYLKKNLHCVMKK